MPNNDVAQDVRKTADDFKTGYNGGDHPHLDKVIKDIADERQKLGAGSADYKKYMQKVDAELHQLGFPPAMILTDVDQSGTKMVLTERADQSHVSYLDSSGTTTPADATTAPPKPTQDAATQQQQTEEYTVQPGDSLWKIVKRQHPDWNNQQITQGVDEIARANHLDENGRNRNEIKVGEPLQIPKSGDGAVTPPDTTKPDDTAPDATQPDATPAAEADVAGKPGVVNRNDSGQPVGVELPDGSTRTITRDDKGNITEISSSRGGGFKKVDGEWHITQNGEVTDTTVKNVQMDNDGNTIVTNKDNTSTMIKADGTYVHRDADGKVTDVTDLNGNNSLTVEQDGSIVDHRDGSVWKKDEDNQWHKFKGDQDTGETAKEVRVDPNGNQVIVNADGSSTVKGTDGSVKHYGPDQQAGADASITRNKDGQVTAIGMPDGSYREIVRDDSGNVIEVKSSRGGGVKKVDGEWYITQNGEVTDTKVKNVTVDTAGNTTIKNADDTSTVIKPNGLYVHKDKDGNVIDVTGGANNDVIVQVNEDGSVSDNRNGVTWKKAEDQKWHKFQGDQDSGETADEVRIEDNGNVAVVNKPQA